MGIFLYKMIKLKSVFYPCFSILGGGLAKTFFKRNYYINCRACFTQAFKTSVFYKLCKSSFPFIYSNNIHKIQNTEWSINNTTIKNCNISTSIQLNARRSLFKIFFHMDKCSIDKFQLSSERITGRNQNKLHEWYSIDARVGNFRNRLV